MKDGVATSVDNTTVLAAREAGIDVRANVRHIDEPLTNAEKLRFTEEDRVPSTWGEVIQIRLDKQKGTYYEGTYLEGTFSEVFPHGSIYDPIVDKGANTTD